MAQRTRISCEVDLERDGKQTGFLRLPHSIHRSAYGWMGIPIVVLKNGAGPRVLLTAAIHGDEYEGQLALMKLCQQLTADEVRGRIIILPAANYPAALAGLRTSPVDDLNLNRAFPGDPNGRPTEMIADYLEHHLLPISDFLIDLHSGGSSLLYLPSALARPHDGSELSQTQAEMLSAFAAPISYYTGPGGEDRTQLAAAARTGVAAIGTVLGGSGTTTVESLAVADRGVRRVLKHLGSVPGLDVGDDPPPTRFMQVGDSDYYTYSSNYGIWAPLVELGKTVEAGQPAATIYSQQTPWQPPATVAFARSGTVICRRVPGPVHRGDCLFHLATDV